MPRPDRRPKSSPKDAGNGPWKLSTFLCVHLDVGSFPLVGEQLGQPALRVATDAFEEIAQASEGIHVKSFGGGDQAGQHGGGSTTVVTALKHPVFSACRDAAQTALGAVVVDSKKCTLRPKYFQQGRAGVPPCALSPFGAAPGRL